MNAHHRQAGNAPFVAPNSIVRAIWGSADTILLVFAGSAAEFALNRSVDWLFFTGRIPRDPIGRLFSTARFGQEIACADRVTAQQTLERINRIHAAVERQRGATMPAWAHRDVLYMLIDYSERAYALLHRPLTPAERDELYHVFRRVGEGLRIPDLPPTYAAWQIDRARHLARDLAPSDYTGVLYAQYRRHLGALRYRLLLEVQALLVPPDVRRMLRLPAQPALRRLLWLYPLARRLGLRPLLQRLLIPPRYLAQVRQLDAGGIPGAPRAALA
ncbi:oxygenase MpaB family protein [Kallotenue papyrolyticum]|uniref:oxygenase MpaB family protein n=1 Tax=Kallotenue papyrolyticum TaxID=1325125 RepID=UPI0004924408|nr:oxygenase MpaB family protein [Kallotenue papyrolyticum]